MELEANTIGAEQDFHFWRKLQAFLVAFTKIGRAGKAFKPSGAYVFAVETANHRRCDCTERLIGVITKATGLCKRIRRGVIRQKIVVTERPPAVRDISSTFKVDWIHRHAAAAPNGR